MPTPARMMLKQFADARATAHQAARAMATVVKSAKSARISNSTPGKPQSPPTAKPASGSRTVFSATHPLGQTTDMGAALKIALRAGNPPVAKTADHGELDRLMFRKLHAGKVPEVDPRAIRKLEGWSPAEVAQTVRILRAKGSTIQAAELVRKFGKAPSADSAVIRKGA